ncbi:hypothetical protein [uncultured Pseudoalteromonas sp.]|uniref:hypothetical protein n=1 Tax=uncultured Pseudoalteromonas sp. TaxID=114053 RepID=UPI002598D3F8|nr:hypothetical protein [uncultured Pseudoalteromonas sp.]
MSLCIPQLRMVEHLNREDINVGEATIVATKKGGLSGWALPGGKFTTRRSLAFNACAKINNIILDLGGIKSAMKVKRAA